MFIICANANINSNANAIISNNNSINSRATKYDITPDRKYIY